MRIAVFVEFFPPRLGSDRRIFEIMSRLTSRHEIHFIVIPPLRLFYGAVKPSGTIRRHLRKKGSHWQRKKIRGHFISVSPRIFSLWRGKIGVIAYLLTMFSLFFKVFIVLKKIDPQVIVLNFPSANTGILGLAAGKVLGKRVFTDFCDLIAEYTCALLGIKGVRAKGLLMIQRFIVKRSNKVITATGYIGTYVRRMKVPSRNIVTIPNGVDLVLFDPSKYRKEMLRKKLHLPIEDKVCVYHGRLDTWAGRNILEKIASWLEEKKVDVKILLAGEGEEMPDLENVFSLGLMPYKDIPVLLSSADVVLVPFPDEDYAHAASPLKLFEGMAMACPIVASKISGVQEGIRNGECGILVDPTDIEGWCKSIIFLLHNPLLSKGLGDCARKTVEKFYDWDILAHQYEKALFEPTQKYVL